MNDLESRLRQVDPAGPPLGFDPDDVVTKAAKRQRTRRGVVATTVTTLAVVAGAVAVFGAGAKPAAVPAAAAPTSEWDLPPLPYRPIPQLPSPHVNLTAQKARNLQHLKDVLPAILPGARDVVVGDFQQLYGDNDWDSITTTVEFTDGQGIKRRFNMTINGPAASQMTETLEGSCRRRQLPDGSVPEPVTGPDGKRLRCDKIPQPDGSTLVISESGRIAVPLEEAGKGGPGTVVPGALNGVIYRADGTNLNVLGLPGDDKATGFPVDQEQITRLLTDPVFTLR